MDDVLGIFRVRLLSDKDLGYVARSWKESLYATGKHPRHATDWRNKSKSAFFANVNAPIDILLANAITEVVLDPIDRTYIVGWCCYDSEAIHYVFVRDVLRDTGIGQALLDRAGATQRQPLLATHWVDFAPAKHLLDKYKAQHAPGLVYERGDNAKAKDSANAGHLTNLARRDTAIGQ